jgi:hypothetical protein
MRGGEYRVSASYLRDLILSSYLPVVCEEVNKGSFLFTKFFS